MAANEAGAGNFQRRDKLLELQQHAQRRWAELKVFESDAPAEGKASPHGKFFGNFPYPYMNGLLHLGHAFSLSKLEFASAYHRLCGRNVLFPQGFHCTGMPIKACADKLERELTLYGCPPKFPQEAEGTAEAAAAAQDAADQAAATKDPTKFASKKSKAMAKKGAGDSQWEILAKSGIPVDEIPLFRHTDHWLKYFPPQAKRDMMAMGCGIDWRRSFITTDVNPFYDSFVAWQFRTLRKSGRIVKDKRYAVYSPLDGQPCADHDRATGEGAGPQEYTLIKMQAVELNGKLAQLQGKGAVFFLAATLRPETMYGQTNCWVLPEGKYGAFRGLNGEIYVMTQRSALNLSYQDRMPETGKPELLLELTGQDLIGTPLKAPNCPHEHIYVLPLLTILTNKGTGVVTSVPSDSPDDYAALMDLKKKDKLREKFGVKDEWVLPFEIIPIIDIPGFGDRAAERVCTDLKITSQNDTKKLAEAKAQVYLKGFTDGVMVVAPHKGKKVSDVKPVIKEELIQSGQAILYSEPERSVISRSGGECVVALTDQWYIIYGEEEWAKATRQCLAQMETFADECRHGFEHTLGWLNQWACSRSFGLGTRLPWDPQYLIESLSDSTIYMAYYAVAHLLQGGDMYGQSASAVQPQDLTDDVWDYVFLEGAPPASSNVPQETLQRMKREFEFWYPFDLRVSGKDLIQNHLTFCLYNHTAIWAGKPDKWPRAVRCNGHLMLNAEKMSKSTGNFKTLEQAIMEYSADAMRMALADAGDALDDANFEHSTANGAILRLTKELAFIEETLEGGAGLRDGQTYFVDRAFDNEMNIAVHASKKAYDSMLFREALKCAWYDLQNARDTYRFACGPEGMKRDLALRYIEVQTLLLAPICPHTCEHIWSDLLRREGSVLTAGWPAAPEPDFALQRAAQYLESQIPALRKVIQKVEAPPKAKKGQAPGAPAAKVTHGDLYVAETFGGWQGVTLKHLRTQFDAASRTFPKDVFASTVTAVKESGSAEGVADKALKQTVLPFAKLKMEEAQAGGEQVLDVKLPFNELELLRENREYLLRALKLEGLEVHSASEAGPTASAEEADRIRSALPGTPYSRFTSKPSAL
ncbi:hypothetical protein WJX72_010942 [[Myrmecia] bisecta]|uniref:leucine--tRNA ligase n=1 Tax=[Myrmecia] bisecta TaxID=41462 RepID=A0AAW1P9I6_9CHLO